MYIRAFSVREVAELRVVAIAALILRLVVVAFVAACVASLCFGFEVEFDALLSALTKVRCVLACLRDEKIPLWFVELRAAQRE